MTSVLEPGGLRRAVRRALIGIAPRPIAQRILAARRRLGLRRLLASWTDVAIADRLMTESQVPKGMRAVTLFPKELGGRPLLCRPNTTDLDTLFSTFRDRFHMPPASAPPPRRILDLGANVGYTLAHLAASFPDSFIVGVEMDPQNFALAELNTAAWRQRVRVVNAAVWHEAGSVNYCGGAEDAYSVRTSTVNPDYREGRVAKAITVDGLLREFQMDQVDFVKMDIEGAERAILLEHDPSWLSRVACLKIEIHNDAPLPPYFDVLNKYGLRSCLGGQVKSGQSWTGQNRPVVAATGTGLLTS